MTKEKEFLKTLQRKVQFIKGWRALVLLGVLTLALASAAVLVAHLSATRVLAGHGDVEVWPAYYEDGIVSVMMGPSGNSANPNQATFACYLGLGPDISEAAQPKGLPKFYTLFVPGATQMHCPDGSLAHDMVVTAVPGDPGYNPKVQIIGCGPGENFDVSKMPYTSAAAVEAGIAANELACGPFGVLLSPVVRGP